VATTISRDEVVLQEHGITPTSDAVAAYRLGMRAVSVTAELELRQRELFDPYHGAISSLLDARLAAGRPVVFIAIHSFTPEYLGQSRPWQVALLSHRDRRLTDWMLAALRQDPALCVGDNTPYRVTDEGDYGIPVHAERRGLPHLLIELRQDLIAEAAGQGAWIERLASLLKTAPRFQP
jgi:predicted N-formylglutamate amidohydrolase